MTAVSITPAVLQTILGRHLPLYRTKLPVYQSVMLNSLLGLWSGRHERLLDVGGGTGVIAQAMAELFPVGSVQTVDLIDRFCPTLSVATRQYDGRALPFARGAFDAATLNNVLHHVPVEARAGLLREIRRVAAGPLYIKDHVSRSRVDDLRLMAMDAIGNIPFGGMLWARYLSTDEWEALAAAAGYRIGARGCGSYRSGPYAAIFPNRLEITLRLDPIG
jgi:SAM-dependent methyltransferase